MVNCGKDASLDSVEEVAPVHFNQFSDPIPVFIVFDRISSEKEKEPEISRQILRYLREAADRHIAVTVMDMSFQGLRVIHDMSTDAKVFSAAMDKLTAGSEQSSGELVIGTPERFHCGKQLASYVGLVPEEKSSGDRRRLRHISKQGDVLLRFLLVERGAGHGAQSAGVAQQVLPSRYASEKEDCQGGHGAETGGAPVLDVAPGLRLWPDAEARFATRESPDIPMVCSQSPM